MGGVVSLYLRGLCGAEGGKMAAVVVDYTQIMQEVEFVENIRALIERGFMGGIVIAAVFAGFAGFLYLLYRFIKLMRPKKVRQEEQRILSHRFYKVSGRGRVAYLILCLEKTLQFYKQDFTAWEWLLRRLWAITNNPQNNWIDAWLDTIGELLPSEVLTNNNGSTISEEIEKAQNLYTQAGYAMIVINSILDSTYTMVCEWSPNTNAYDPDALYHIDKVEETMKQFEIPLPSSEIVQRLLSEQKSSSFGEPFDGLCFSGISKGK
jgi:hypothetical protein